MRYLRFTIHDLSKYPSISVSVLGAVEHVLTVHVTMVHCVEYVGILIFIKL